MTQKNMLFACWIPKATNKHPEYIIIVAFPLQQWLSERAVILSYTYIACLVYYENSTKNTYWGNNIVFISVKTEVGLYILILLHRYGLR